MASQQEIDFIRNSDDWPHWPVLPVVNKKTGKAGILMANGGLTVYLTNMYKMPDDLRTVEAQRYPDTDTLLDDWRID